MLINVSRIATSSGFGQAISVTRMNAGEYVDGIYKEGSTSEIGISSSVQPPSSKDLFFLPEGQRTKQLMRFITTEKLKTADEGEKNTADIISWNGLKWRIINVKDWSRHGYYRSVGEQIKI